MQSIEIIVNIAWLIIGTLCGGLITRLVIRALEINEREREGDFLALIYLKAARDHIEFGEIGGLNAIMGKGWSGKQERVVNGLIQSAARCQKKYREKIYQISMRIAKTTWQEQKLYIESSEIESLISEMEICYFNSPSGSDESRP